MKPQKSFKRFEEKCTHKRKKKNYPFGRKSAPSVQCKDCGAVITKLDMKKAKGRGMRR